jgi:hypothetical protein
MQNHERNLYGKAVINKYTSEPSPNDETCRTTLPGVEGSPVLARQGCHNACQMYTQGTPT